MKPEILFSKTIQYFQNNLKMVNPTKNEAIIVDTEENTEWQDLLVIDKANTKNKKLLINWLFD